jgi:hypothetical protein
MYDRSREHPAIRNAPVHRMQSVQKQVHEALARGMTLAETQKAVDLDSIRLQFTHDDPELNASFQGNFTPLRRSCGACDSRRV